MANVDVRVRFAEGLGDVNWIAKKDGDVIRATFNLGIPAVRRLYDEPESVKRPATQRLALLAVRRTPEAFSAEAFGRLVDRVAESVRERESEVDRVLVEIEAAIAGREVVAQGEVPNRPVSPVEGSHVESEWTKQPTYLEATPLPRQRALPPKAAPQTKPEYGVHIKGGLPHCPNCGRQVSYRRGHCRACGHQYQDPTLSIILGVGMIVAILVLAAIGAAVKQP